MQVFVVLLSVAAVALASLEPAGYRPPGSSSSQYLPPHLQQHHEHDHDHDHEHHHQSQANNPSTASQYLPPSYNHPAAPAANPNSQYLPPRARQQQQPQRPSSNYLPAADKPIPSLAPPSPPANDYQPPAQSGNQQSSNEYLPPQSSRPTSAPANDYLPPSRTTPAVPANDYLPPLKPSTPSIPAKPEYLPPAKTGQSAVPPKSDYLPPSSSSSSRVNSRYSATTPVPRISVVSVSPYKLDGPAYSKPQPKFSGLATSASSSPARSGYPQRGYPSGAPAAKSFEQPADNYLPPLGHDESSQGYESSAAQNAGYQYGAAARSEQTTEPAKYEFEYRVSDEFGNDFGHKESRDGAQTSGVYSVLLPDGRKQIVHYEADENGFKPRISYEEAASVLGPKTPTLADIGFGGYDKNANSLDAHQGPY
ncbi:extensin [Nasonia vitripennis]|uniref:Uncharacterized protein n=1 Tax=Nasonia vitripennis TaxID=7425 RepID=A0A7M7G5W4_NASVI|nr:extensin [Nasonia vitripennis]